MVLYDRMLMAHGGVWAACLMASAHLQPTQVAAAALTPSRRREHPGGDGAAEQNPDMTHRIAAGGQSREHVAVIVDRSRGQMTAWL